MLPRPILALIAVLAVCVLAGCGGSSDQTASLGKETLTVPSDTHGVYAELQVILDQLPYQSWYTTCVVDQVKKVLSPAEAEALAELPEGEREKKAFQVISTAGPTCEREHHRPTVDPNASTEELDLLRAGYVTSMTAVAESNGATAGQIACVEKGFEELPDPQVIGIANAPNKVREGILLSVFKPCAAAD
ncbi:MAG TPA: hypothetical protein VHZ54_12105 [Solirubrobacterales bacterium]|nr:hypothetical protein [Solirubrobacterales bacterium]